MKIDETEQRRRHKKPSLNTTGRIAWAVKWPYGKKGTCWELFADRTDAAEFAAWGYPKGKVVQVRIEEVAPKARGKG